jgi:hypothetical protein
MQLAKSIMLKNSCLALSIILTVLLGSVSFSVSAQDNSPYSRYGLGDLVPATNITTRGIGSISAGYSDIFSINYNNPASYSQFQAVPEAHTKKLSYGRVIFDVGTNYSSRTLVTPNTTNRFTASDLMFSYMQVGFPIKKNWGVSFGLRPISRISYMINRYERLKDPSSGANIDSAITQFRGTGGSYLPTIGTGFGFTVGSKTTTAYKHISTLSFGANGGYYFGSRENTTLRSLLNDTVNYYASDHTTNASFGDLYFNTGLQFQTEHTDYVKKSSTVFRFGISGNWEQKIKGSKDSLRQTYTLGSAGEKLQVDSVYQSKGLSGEIILPANYTAGFVLQHTNANFSGWLLGLDFSHGSWSKYRFFGQADDTQDNWMVNLGGQIIPKPRTNYFSNVVYRFGLFSGKDYIRVQDKNLPVFGASFGMGLPIANHNRLSMNQSTMVNLAFEYSKRGNNDNLLKENMFRVSLGFNFTDLWFGKKKYD